MMKSNYLSIKLGFSAKKKKKKKKSTPQKEDFYVDMLALQEWFEFPVVE